MTPKAIFFGAIGTLTETSDMQRRAFNAAFAEAGLDWHWDMDAYLRLLETPGGHDRIATYAAARGARVNAGALHAAKVAQFERLAREEGLTPREGVTELIAAARSGGLLLGLVTTTGPDTVELILNGLSRHLDRSAFDIVCDRSMVERGKPEPDVYLHALSQLGLPPHAALAIEDTPESAEAALSAGLPTVAFPGVAAAERAFPPTARRIGALSPDLVRGIAAAVA